MVKLFKKVGADISRFGKKVGGDISKAFKKGGVVEEGIKKAGVALSSAGSQVGKYSNIAGNVLNKIEASPLGKFIPSPVLGVAEGIVKAGQYAGNLGRASKGISKDLTSGRSAGKITENVLERVVKVKEEAPKINFA